jgi:hypothetical protein
MDIYWYIRDEYHKDLNLACGIILLASSGIESLPPDFLYKLIAS